MSENVKARDDTLIEVSCDVISAYVSNNSISPADLLDLIVKTHATLQVLATGAAAAVSEIEIERPSAAQIRKSVTPNGIVSFIDGKTYKALKRHLSTHGLDSHAYRARFGLPADYPMVAAAYAARRSELARSTGLGKIRRTNESVDPEAVGHDRAASPSTTVTTGEVGEAGEFLPSTKLT